MKQQFLINFYHWHVLTTRRNTFIWIVCSGLWSVILLLSSRTGKLTSDFRLGVAVRFFKEHFRHFILVRQRYTKYCTCKYKYRPWNSRIWNKCQQVLVTTRFHWGNPPPRSCILVFTFFIFQRFARLFFLFCTTPQTSYLCGEIIK